MAVFCVSCGVAFTEESQEGTVCKECRQKFESRRIQVLVVKYCYMCGMQFIPSDSAISHLHCFVSMGEEDGNSSRGYSMQ